MTVKTTGFDFKRFYADTTFWPQDNGETWHDDEIITINGVEQPDGVNIETLADDAQVKIEGGIVYGPKWERDQEPSLEGYFRQWLKKQNTATLVVTCDVAKLDAVKAAIKQAGGKIA